MTTQITYRCAIYTRKSHEDGLDQDFNSLDAQYEACKAYTASQIGLGWKLREARYDDGGISGGHIKRPALQTLIRDIKAGLIDVIVVYKVDRLTRSLTDFAKLVEIFDEHDVSFVSVTQAFNTTTSMGRLTLNVLLSFAQFEREVTAERIRDKFAASKKRGIWMGGTYPIGYQQKDRKLHIVNDEADTVRTIFRLYIERQSASDIKAKLDSLGLKSKMRLDKDGKKRGGQKFSVGAIYWILKNPIHIGKIKHKDILYEGDHDAVISEEDWNCVQNILENNSGKRIRQTNSKCTTLLRDLLEDADRNPLVPKLARNRNKTYRYYVSKNAPKNRQDSGWRIPAKTIEPIIRDLLNSTLGSRLTLLDLLNLQSPSVDLIGKIDDLGRTLCDGLKSKNKDAQRKTLITWIDKITIESDKLSVRFNASAFENALHIELPETKEIRLAKPMTLRRRGQELKMIIGGDTQTTAKPDTSLIRLVSKAYELRTGLEDGSMSSIKAFAEKYSLDHADAKRLLPLGYLAPDIVKAILSGRQPVHLTLRDLKRSYKLPILWSEQRSQLGFPKL